MQKDIRYGIQGGPGSFNESVLRLYEADHAGQAIKPHYLNTTDNVLRSLSAGDIDLGQFALFNSYAGLYAESLQAIGAFLFRPVGIYRLAVRHVMMIRRDAELDSIKRIVSHPEVFKQCKNTLAQKFAHLSLVEGKNGLEDPARAGEALSKGEFDPHTAIVSNALIAETHGLKIVAENLQDIDCISTFLVVESSDGNETGRRTGTERAS